MIIENNDFFLTQNNSLNTGCQTNINKWPEWSRKFAGRKHYDIMSRPSLEVQNLGKIHFPNSATKENSCNKVKGNIRKNNFFDALIEKTKPAKPIRAQDLKRNKESDRSFEFSLGKLRPQSPKIKEKKQTKIKQFPTERFHCQFSETRTQDELDKEEMKNFYRRQKVNSYRTQSAIPKYSVETQMNRKIRVQSCNVTMDSGQRAKSSYGDKAYRVNECSPEFFKEPGLTVGSTAFCARKDKNVVLKNKPKNWSNNVAILEQVYKHREMLQQDTMVGFKNTEYESERQRKYFVQKFNKKKRENKTTKKVYKVAEPQRIKEGEVKDVKCVHRWENNVLKEFNPKWRDPDDDEWWYKNVADKQLAEVKKQLIEVNDKRLKQQEIDHKLKEIELKRKKTLDFE